MSLTLTRPHWPDAEDQKRIVHGAARLALLEDDWDKYLDEFLGRVQGEERKNALGVLDTAWNLLASYARQMSVPGLYGDTPIIHSPAGSEWLTGRGGMLTAARWAPKMMRMEYLTRGLGDMLQCVHVSRETGRLQLRPVYPHDLWVEGDPDEPDRAQRLAELRLRRLDGEWAWTWDVYDLRDLDRPVFYVQRGELDGSEEHRITSRVVEGVDGNELAGEDYPWRYVDGRPYIRYVHYQASISSGYWSWRDGLGLHRGSFQAARLSNTALHSADSAAFPVVAVIDGMLKGVSVRNEGTSGALSTLQLTPGAFFNVISTSESRPAMLQTISGSADALALASMVRGYSLSIMSQHGLRGEDVSRDQANPTSGAALSIQDNSRREGQRQLRDLFAPADQELLAMVAAQAGALELGTAPERGHEIEYRLIQQTAAEQAAEQDAQAFELEHGLVSRVQLYMRRHGVARDAALAALREIAADEAALTTPPKPTP